MGGNVGDFTLANPILARENFGEYVIRLYKQVKYW